MQRRAASILSFVDFAGRTNAEATPETRVHAVRLRLLAGAGAQPDFSAGGSRGKAEAGRVEGAEAARNPESTEAAGCAEAARRLFARSWRGAAGRHQDP